VAPSVKSIASTIGLVVLLVLSTACTQIELATTTCANKADNTHRSAGTPGQLVGKTRFACEDPINSIVAEVQIERNNGNGRWTQVAGASRSAKTEYAAQAVPRQRGGVNGIYRTRSRIPGRRGGVVAFGILKHDPGDVVALAEVGPAGAQSEQPLDRAGLVVGGEVEVKPVLAGLRVRHRYEAQARLDVLVRCDVDLVVRLVHHPPAKRLCPPTAQAPVIAAVDDLAVPANRHRIPAPHVPDAGHPVHFRAAAANLLAFGP
jgi:hypothetical protein